MGREEKGRLGGDPEFISNERSERASINSIQCKSAIIRYIYFICTYFI